MQTSNLKFIRKDEIDHEKYDYCVGNALNARVYAISWYLDRTAPVWEALVWGDYEYVMPLPVGRKMGIKYIYQPYFSQQLGIFPSAPVDIQQQFAKALAAKYRFCHIQVNPHVAPDAFVQFDRGRRVNYILPLHDPHATIASQYKANARYHIADAYKKGIRIVNTMNSTEYVELKKRYLGVKVDNESFRILLRLISWTLTNGNGQILAAITPNNEICAAAFFLKHGNRLIYLNSFSTPEGRRFKAMYALLNEVIRRYAGTGINLDFEGSSIERIATFFKSFNPAEEHYHYLYLNNLPFPLKYFKKKRL